MEYKYDNSNVPFTAYAIVKDNDLQYLPCNNDPFKDGGATRVVDYGGMMVRGNQPLVVVGYKKHKLQFAYTEQDFIKILIGHFITILN